MGTDIHMVVEVRDGDGWRLATKDGWNDRNYDVFAMLADVRNGYGFAGCVTGSGFEIIHAQRGIPADLSRDVKAANTEDAEDGDSDQEDSEDRYSMWLGDHSFTWATAREVRDFFAVDRTTRKRGVVDVLGYIAFLVFGKPYSYSGDVSGSMVRHIGIESMAVFAVTKQAHDMASAEYLRWKDISSRPERAEYAEHDAKRVEHYLTVLGWCRDNMRGGVSFNSDGMNLYTEVWWDETYRQRAAGFLDWFSRVVDPLVAAHGADNVRLVYGFDS